MGTRAIIKVKGLKNVVLYKHYDGYPESTLPWLEKFAKEFHEERGHDPEYCFAQLIRSSVRLQDEFNLGDSNTTGWGVITGRKIEAGQEYEYTINEGKIEVKSLHD